MKYSPFQELYNRDSEMPKEIKHKLPSIVNFDLDEILDTGISDAAWISSKAIREEMYRQEVEKWMRKMSNVVITTVTSLQHQMI